MALQLCIPDEGFENVNVEKYTSFIPSNKEKKKESISFF